eukprot:4389966-Pyramimonas_sp.AAC.1
MLIRLCRTIADAYLYPHFDPCTFLRVLVGRYAVPYGLASSYIASTCVYVSGFLRITIAPVALPR